MTGRIILTVLLLVICLISIQIGEQIVAPKSADDLAVQQIQEDGSREQMRIQQYAQNYFYSVVYGLTFLLICIIWSSPIKMLFLKIKNKYYNN